MLTATVSNIESFRIWQQDPELDIGWILQRILHPPEPTPAMKAGTAFHKALEHAELGTKDVLSADGYRFEFERDVALELPAFREFSITHEYSDLLVRGRVDGMDGLTVIDYKTVAQFDADRLLEGYQWRFYLDMLGASKFRWFVFVLTECAPELYSVRDIHVLEQARYPQLHNDCARLARHYTQFAEQHLPVLTAA